MSIGEAYKELAPFFERAKKDEKLATYLLRTAQGATMDAKSLDEIAEMIYLVSNQGGKSTEDIKTELKGFAAGLIVNRAVHEQSRAG